jgi:hypothetical protein
LTRREAREIISQLPTSRLLTQTTKPFRYWPASNPEERFITLPL